MEILLAAAKTGNNRHLKYIL